MELNEVQKKLNENLVYGEVFPHIDGVHVCVEIQGGDWKHQHLACDKVMEQLGFLLTDIDYTDEDCDMLEDAYDATHIYLPPTEAKVEMEKRNVYKEKWNKLTNQEIQSMPKTEIVKYGYSIKDGRKVYNEHGVLITLIKQD